MLKLFAYEHLRADLQAHSKPFSDLAHLIAATIPEGPERTVALRKLLEAKDAAVRAVAIPEPGPLAPRGWSFGDGRLPGLANDQTPRS